jgi:DNA anti-recombination protein RmuC
LQTELRSVREQVLMLTTELTDRKTEIGDLISSLYEAKKASEEANAKLQKMQTENESLVKQLLASKQRFVDELNQQNDRTAR